MYNIRVRGLVAHCFVSSNLNPGGEGLAAGDGGGGLLDEALQLCQRALFKRAAAVYCRVIDTGGGGELEFVKKK